MLKAFVESISALVTKTIRPTPVCELTTRRRAALAMPDGSLRFDDRELPDRVATAATLIELARLAVETETTDEKPGRAIFVDETGAMLLVPTRGGEDRAVCKFALSDAWHLLRELDKNAGAALDQKNFIRRGRFTLRMTPDQLEPFRRLDFTITNQAMGDVRKTSESIGRELSARVMAGGPIPDSIEVQVPIFDTVGENTLHRVILDVEIASAEQRIILKPAPGELESRMAQQLADAAARLVKAMGDVAAQVPVYLGSAWK